MRNNENDAIFNTSCVKCVPPKSMLEIEIATYWHTNCQCKCHQEKGGDIVTRGELEKAIGYHFNGMLYTGEEQVERSQYVDADIRRIYQNIAKYQANNTPEISKKKHWFKRLFKSTK